MIQSRSYTSTPDPFVILLRSKLFHHNNLGTCPHSQQSLPSIALVSTHLKATTSMTRICKTLLYVLLYLPYRIDPRIVYQIIHTETWRHSSTSTNKKCPVVVPGCCKTMSDAIPAPTFEKNFRGGAGTRGVPVHYRDYLLQ